MKVLHVITSLAAGGAERQLAALLRHTDMPCEVATLTDTGREAGVAALGVPVHSLRMRGNRDVSAVGRLVTLMREGRYDVVHTHLYRACVYGRFAARLAGVPAIVATEHSLCTSHIEGRPKNASIRALYRASERVGHLTVAVSRAVADRLAEWGVRRVHVVPNGIDAAAFAFDPEARRARRAAYGIPADAFVIGGLGRLVRSKRFDVLLSALGGLPSAWLLLVGEGPARPILEALARYNGVADRVVITGEVPDVPAHLAAMDVLAAPAEEETFGLAVLEGLAAGLPVLHAACPSLDELPPGAAPGARRVAPGHTSFRAELCALAQSDPVRLPPPPAVAHYDIRRHVGALTSLYAHVLTRGPLPSYQPDLSGPLGPLGPLGSPEPP
ncbi:glycosyltransferase [Bailinhaonella thermotolerans]|uniref:Glycosyltransferase n=1 Tax=Bailinhaonella thermotolerans TaxID=1070861 RepID=A0A3A4A861_9ACTN|nr:glycosyltransferase [Bailinhaonella thermotolerans]RJL22083.1 glycosyltransferase [Bailinhaonella thermotolerans]